MTTTKRKLYPVYREHLIRCESCGGQVFGGWTSIPQDADGKLHPKRARKVCGECVKEGRA